MSDELRPLRAAAKGRLYPSEGDEPIEVVTDAKVPANAKASSVESFLGELRGEKEAARFAKLQAAVEATLTEAKVYRFGETGVDVWILGKTKGDALAGLHTTSVET